MIGLEIEDLGFSIEDRISRVWALTSEIGYRINGSMMLSNPQVGKQEGFNRIGDWQRDTCAGGVWVIDGASERTPMFVHYSQGILGAGTWNGGRPTICASTGSM